MISEIDFRTLNNQVKTIIEKSFDKAKTESKNNDFVLFLSNAQYVEKLKNTNNNPYVVNYSPDKRHDSFRLNILMDYINSNYAFQSENTIDSYLSLTFELMIYTHMWESKPFLKQLYRFANLTNGLEYLWDVTVPDYPKHPFIKKIRKLFEKVNLELSELILTTFNSSLRNAFSHSEYYFGRGTPEIFLSNYKGNASHEIDKITFDK